MAQWYTFTTSAGADPTVSTNYSNPQPNKPACPGNTKICAILANDDGFGFPMITNAILSDMVRALQLGIDQTTVALRN